LLVWNFVFSGNIFLLTNSNDLDSICVQSCFKKNGLCTLALLCVCKKPRPQKTTKSLNLQTVFWNFWYSSWYWIEYLSSHRTCSQLILWSTSSSYYSSTWEVDRLDILGPLPEQVASKILRHHSRIKSTHYRTYQMRSCSSSSLGCIKTVD
jgi:hypothetical protein